MALLKNTVRLLLQSPTVWTMAMINRQSGNGGFSGIGIGSSSIKTSWTIHLHGCHQIGFLTAFHRTKDFG